MKFKLTKLEKFWILYDVGNSAFILLVSTMIPIYFNYLAENAGISSVNYLAYWGYAASAATLVVALIGPVGGALADTQNYKKRLFLAFIIIGVLCCASLGLLTHWLVFLVVFVIAKIGYSSANVFYDSMLTDITEEERMDQVSSHGFAWGYIGSCVPFVICLGIVFGGGSLGLTMQQSMLVSFLVIALWWSVCSLPLLAHYRQTHFAAKGSRAISSSFRRLADTFAHMRREKHIFVFLLAYFFYIDGVYTIIDMATAYGQALGFDSTGLLGALLLTQLVAFPCSILFGRLSRTIDSGRLITVCIAAYLGIAVFAFFMTSPVQFWILAVCVGMFQGGIQALSRSYFAKIIPADQSGEYFGILDICGKGASFLGTTLVGVISQLTGSINFGVGSLVVLFVLGMLLFRQAVGLKAQLSPSKSDS